MGLLDDVLGNSVPKGNLAKPLIIALGALVASGALHRQSTSTASPGSATAPGGADGGLLAGLGGLLERFQQSGQADLIKSWIGSGQNLPISASQLGTVLGPSIIKALAAKTGISEQDLTSQLSQILPGVVDKLTPNGRMPTPTEVSQSR